MEKKQIRNWVGGKMKGTRGYGKINICLEAQGLGGRLSH